MLTLVLTRSAKKALVKCPDFIRDAFYAWAAVVAANGTHYTRTETRFKDEPLKGERHGQYSVRLNRQWRIIYTETHETLTITILEVTPHDYRTK